MRDIHRCRVRQALEESHRRELCEIVVGKHGFERARQRFGAPHRRPDDAADPAARQQLAVKRGIRQRLLGRLHGQDAHAPHGPALLPGNRFRVLEFHRGPDKAAQPDVILPSRHALDPGPPFAQRSHQPAKIVPERRDRPYPGNDNPFHALTSTVVLATPSRSSMNGW